MTLDQFNIAIKKIICNSEKEIRKNSDFLIEELPIAIDGIRYVSEYIDTHKSETEFIFNEVQDCKV